jgi:hypothetical protein
MILQICHFLDMSCEGAFFKLLIFKALQKVDSVFKRHDMPRHVMSLKKRNSLEKFVVISKC